MKNTLLRAFLPATLFALILGGCQKNLDSASEEGLRGGTQMLSSHCPACVETWAGTEQVISLDNNFQAIVKHDQTKYYLRIERTSGTFGNIRVASPGVATDASNAAQGTNVGFDPATTSYPTGVGTFLEFDLDSDWEGCDEITFSFSAGGIGAGGSYTTGPVSYYLRKLCTVTTLTPAATTICLDATQTLTATVSANEAFQGGELVIEEDIAGSWTEVASVVVTNITKSVTYDVTSSNEETRTFRAVYEGTGQYNTSMSSNATVTFEECGTCEDEFSAVLTCGETKTLVVTFTPCEDGDYVIQGGLTNGTTVVSADGSAGLTRNTTHNSVVNSNANVTRWEGTLMGGMTYTVTIEYTGGAGVGSWSAKSIVDEVEVTNGYVADQDCAN